MKEEEQNEWSDQKMVAEEKSLKEKKKDLNPVQKEEAYLLLVALLLIASGPAGIVLSASLIASYSGIKAYQLKQFIDKAKKIKAQRILQEQNLLKSDTLDKKEELTEEQKTKEDLEIKRAVGEDLTSKLESRENQGTEEDLLLALSHLDDELLDQISNMPDAKIDALGQELSQTENPNKIAESLLSLKKNVHEITTSSNTLNPETQEQAKSLNAKLNKLISESNKSEIEGYIPAPSRVVLKRDDNSPSDETSQTESPGVGLFPPKDPILRHDINLISGKLNPTKLDGVKGSLEIANGKTSTDFLKFTTPSVKLNQLGQQIRSAQLENTAKSKKSQTAQTTNAQTTSARRKAK